MRAINVVLRLEYRQAVPDDTAIGPVVLVGAENQLNIATWTLSQQLKDAGMVVEGVSIESAEVVEMEQAS